MNHYLSTYLFVNHRLTTGLLQEIQQVGIPALEIFCARQHFDYHGKEEVAELGRWFRDSQLKLHSLHSPLFNDEAWGGSGPDTLVTIAELAHSKRRPMVDEIKRALDIAEIIPFRYLIQHVGVTGEDFSLQKVDACFAALEELAIFARQRGVEILLENIPNDLSTADRLVEFNERTHLNLNFAFDIGHAHLCGGVAEQYRVMQSRIRSTHIHDNDGKEDNHLFPMVCESGGIDWREAMHILRSASEQYPLLLELRGQPDFSNSLQRAVEIFEELEGV